MTTLGKINDAELSSQVKEKSTHDKNKAFSEGTQQLNDGTSKALDQHV
jgi:X-X-X-Leu-X-X-Gly heptad repeat protein